MITLFIGIQISGLALTTDFRINRSHMMQNFLNPPRQFGKHQTRAEQIEKCLVESLEPTYHLSIFMLDIKIHYFVDSHLCL